MFRLQDRQLHIILIMMLIACGVLFGFTGFVAIPEREGKWLDYKLHDLSEGWIEVTEKGTEIVNMPATMKAGNQDYIMVTHTLPDMGLEDVYLLMETNSQIVQLEIDKNTIYETDQRDSNIHAYHMIPLQANLVGKKLVIYYSADEKKHVDTSLIQYGTLQEVLQYLVMENLGNLGMCLGLFLISIVLLIIYVTVNNVSFAKKLLLYGILEGMNYGILFLIQGSIVPTLTGWNYGVDIIKCCLVVVGIVLHLLVLRCFVMKKELIRDIDYGVIISLIYFISMLVLQYLQLVSFDVLYFISLGVYVAFALFYLIIVRRVLARKRQNSEQRTSSIHIFWQVANGIFILSVLIQLVMHFVGRDMKYNDIFVPIGIVGYMLVVWYIGLKRCIYVAPKKTEVSCSEAEIRAKVLDNLNYNLVFAGFHTLQNLIKSGSANSVKMIYYISVYLKGNLKWIEKPFEIITIEEELEHIMAYLQLQKTRNNGLEFKLECKVKGFHVPRRSLEPIVENAVKHGIAGKNNKGNVVVRTYMRQEGYAIQIIDDGIGFQIKDLKNNSDTALLKMKEELINQCKAQVEIISHENKGTVVTIILPMIENDLMDDIDIE